MAVYYPDGGPGAYAQNQQGRQDDQFREILKMMMMGMQQKQQQGQYQDQMKQQQLENAMKEKEYALDERNVASNEAFRNRPRAVTESEAKRQAIMSNPNFSDEQKNRLLSGLDLYDPIEKTKLEEEARLSLRGQDKSREEGERRARYKALGWSDEDIELAMSNQTPTSVLSKREEIKRDADVKKIARIKADPNLTGEQKERLIMGVYGQSGAWEWSERDAKKEWAHAAELGDVSYKAARKGLSEVKPGTKEYNKRVRAYRDSGVYAELPKQYTIIATRASKSVANKHEMRVMSTLGYLYNVIDSGGSIDDIPKDFLRNKIGDAEEFDEGTIRDFFRVYSEEFMTGKPRKPATWRGLEIK